MLRFLRFKPRLLNFPPSERPRSAEGNCGARSAVARWTDRITICLFAGAIAIPPVWGLGFSEPAVPAYEYRNPAPRPAFTLRHGGWRTFAAQFELFFNDRLGFRRNLLECHAYAELNWFEISTSPEVAIGPNGWLFLRTSSPFDLPVQRRPSAAEHARRWCERLRERRDWLAARGTRYLVVITPEKQSIYPEEYPRSLRHLLDEPLLDEFVKQAAQLDLAMVDLRPAVRSGKGSESLYFTYDTHWNGIGGWYGAAEVLSRLKQWYPEFTVPQRSDFSLASVPHPNPDLARMLSMTDVEDPYIYLSRGKQSTARSVPIDYGPETSIQSELKGPKGYTTDCRDRPRALLIHDSFALYMVDQLAEQFHELNCFWSYQFPKKFIERDKPDLVIQEIVERNLKLPPEIILAPLNLP